MSKYAELVNARVRLRELEQELRDEVRPTLGRDARQAVELGVAIEATRAAEDAVFNVLNVLHSHLEDSEATAVVMCHQRIEAVEA